MDEPKKLTKQIFTMTEEMVSGLREVNRATGIPISRLVRNGIRKELAEHGIHLGPDEIRQGGLRTGKQDES